MNNSLLQHWINWIQTHHDLRVLIVQGQPPKEQVKATFPPMSTAFLIVDKSNGNVFLECRALHGAVLVQYYGSMRRVDYQEKLQVSALDLK